MSGPDSAASCYLVRAFGLDPDTGIERWFNVALDMGPGSFGQLWHHIDPCDLDAVIFSHCHADHIADVISLHVHRRWGPGGNCDPVLVAGPAQTPHRIRQVDGADDSETYDGEFIFRELVAGEEFEVGPLRITPFTAWHSVESFGVRIEGPDEQRPGEMVSLFYTGDTDECDSIVEGARGADLLLAEAGFSGCVETRGIHMDGARAGNVARRAEVGAMILTHIQPWTDPEEILSDARRVWAGPVEVARSGQVVNVGAVTQRQREASALVSPQA